MFVRLYYQEAVPMELKTWSQPRDETTRRATVVIADAGNAAEVIVVETDHPLSAGACFTHRGTNWRVVGRRPDSRVVVAQPEDA